MPDPHQSSPVTGAQPDPSQAGPVPDRSAAGPGPARPEPFPDPGSTAPTQTAPPSGAAPVREPAEPPSPTPRPDTSEARGVGLAVGPSARPVPAEDRQAPPPAGTPAHADAATAEHPPPTPARTPGAPAEQPPAAMAATEAAATVPRQKDGTPRLRTVWTSPLRLEPTTLPDLLNHPDPAVAAETAAVENLLRCWVRESGLGRPDAPAATPLRIPLPASGTALLVPVRHWSHAGWHRFGPARLEGTTAAAPSLDAVTVAALIAREGTSGGRGAADLVGRVADSVRRTAEFIADRRERPTAPAPVGADRFLTAEQSLLLGHPLQPDPKSREGLSEAESRRYSPELHGSFPLHWFAVEPAALAGESAWTESGRPVSAPQLLGRLAPGSRCPRHHPSPPAPLAGPRPAPAPRRRRPPRRGTPARPGPAR